MSDQDIIDTIDVSLREHMTPGAPSDGSYCCAWAVLDALRERYAIVKLPEPHSVTDNAAGWPGDGWAVSRNVGKVLADRPKALDPDEARKFAAALLAAANYAEEDK